RPTRNEILNRGSFAWLVNRSSRVRGTRERTLVGLPPVARPHAGERRVAEEEGFEPPVPFRVQWFSRPPPSTTRPPLRTPQSFDFRYLRRVSILRQARGITAAARGPDQPDLTVEWFRPPPASILGREVA